MSGPGQIRASDADREQTAEALREHFAAGRITEDELTERIDAAYRATTTDELAHLRRDLPPLPASPAVRQAQLEQRKTELRRHLLQQAGGALTPFAICTAIWIASGADGAFWPIWVLIFPLVFVVRNGWLYGPAPDIDGVQTELRRGSDRSDRRRERHPERRRPR